MEKKPYIKKKNTEVLAVEMAQWLQVLFSSPMTPHQGRKGSRLHGVLPCHMCTHHTACTDTSIMKKK